MEEHKMTVQELYDFAKKWGFENATIQIPVGPCNYASIGAARVSVYSNEEDKQIYLVYNS